MNKDELHVYFETPLQIDLNKLKPEILGRFTTTVDSVTFTGENMAENLQVGHYATVSVQWVDQQGRPAKVDGLTTWATTDATVLSCAVSTGNPLIANCQAIAIGTAQVQATADADLGEGVKTITSTIDVSVIQGEAVGGQMKLQDMGAGPPPPPPPTSKKY